MGRQRYCGKICQREAMLPKYAAASKRYAERHPRPMRAWWRKQKEAVFDHYGRSCECCGESHLAMLTLDHKNNDGAAHRRQLKMYTIYHWVVKNNFPDLFRVMCFNCNCGRRINGGICPHVTEGVPLVV